MHLFWTSFAFPVSGRRPWLTAALHALQPAVTAVLLTLTIAGFLGRRWWVFDLVSHFHWQYFLVGAVMIASTGLMRQWYTLGAAVIVVALNLLVVWPYIPMPTAVARAFAAEPTATHDSVRLMSANVYYYNPDPERLLRQIEMVDPDVIVLVEMIGRNRAHLRPLWDIYPHVVETAAADQVIFSRLPLHSSEFVTQLPNARPQPVAHLSWQGRPFTVVGVHLSIPITGKMAAWRDAELTKTAAFARRMSTPVVIAGDWNVSSFSPNFRAFVDESGLQDCRRGHGVNASWPTFMPVGRIPIDHIFTSPDIAVRRFMTGDENGSDHLPIIVDFVPPIE